MDAVRAKQIIDSTDNVSVLYQGSPVWLEDVKDNNTVLVTYLDSQLKEDVPAYKLVEVNNMI